ncbi:unnamed protein product [Closterium sp. NIES-54]
MELRWHNLLFHTLSLPSTVRCPLPPPPPAQPMLQECGAPNKALWMELRRHHLLHPQGLPLFHPDFSYHYRPALSYQQLTHLPPDWVVVLAQRPSGKRSFTNAEEVKEAVLAAFPAERVVVFDGSLQLMQVSSNSAVCGRARSATLQPCLPHPPHSSTLHPPFPPSSFPPVPPPLPPSCPPCPTPPLRPSSCPVVPSQPHCTPSSPFPQRVICSAGHHSLWEGMGWHSQTPPPSLTHSSHFPSPTLFPYSPARALFRRTRLFVGGHGAALSNLIFMPVRSHLLEIRPDKCPNRCYNSLAYACSMKYYLLFSEGTCDTTVIADIPRLQRTLNSIARNLKKEDVALGQAWEPA